MKTIGNVIWFILVGLESAIAWFLLGILWCITILGIPFGKQCFKIARLCVWPFGAEVNTNFDKHPIANVIWLILFGIILGIFFFLVGLILCITIIGIPFGKQCFKLAKLSLTPFGATVGEASN